MVFVEWHVRNGKSGMTEMDTRGWECLVYRIVRYPQPWEIRGFKGMDILTVMELWFLFIFFRTHSILCE